MDVRPLSPDRTLDQAIDTARLVALHAWAADAIGNTADKVGDAYATGVRDLLAALLGRDDADVVLDGLTDGMEEQVSVNNVTAICTCGWTKIKGRAAWAQDEALAHQEATGHDASTA